MFTYKTTTLNYDVPLISRLRNLAIGLIYKKQKADIFDVSPYDIETEVSTLQRYNIFMNLRFA
ncbi:MAG: hypothetical protein MJ002_09275 [Paludibacteraceae bacterium]|nr:hypothetical protein [Paludibacteraceae bacterium]